MCLQAVMRDGWVHIDKPTAACLVVTSFSTIQWISKIGSIPVSAVHGWKWSPIKYERCLRIKTYLWAD